MLLILRFSVVTNFHFLQEAGDIDPCCLLCVLASNVFAKELTEGQTFRVLCTELQYNELLTLIALLNHGSVSKDIYHTHLQIAPLKYGKLKKKVDQTITRPVLSICF